LLDECREHLSQVDQLIRLARHVVFAQGDKVKVEPKVALHDQLLEQVRSHCPIVILAFYVKLAFYVERFVLVDNVEARKQKGLGVYRVAIGKDEVDRMLERPLVPRSPDIFVQQLAEHVERCDQMLEHGKGNLLGL